MEEFRHPEVELSRRILHFSTHAPPELSTLCDNAAFGLPPSGSQCDPHKRTSVTYCHRSADSRNKFVQFQFIDSDIIYPAQAD
jgi:hypothetical protein